MSPLIVPRAMMLGVVARVPMTPTIPMTTTRPMSPYRFRVSRHPSSRSVTNSACSVASPRPNSTTSTNWCTPIRTMPNWSRERDALPSDAVRSMCIRAPRTPTPTHRRHSRSCRPRRNWRRLHPPLVHPSSMPNLSHCRLPPSLSHPIVVNFPSHPRRRHRQIPPSLNLPSLTSVRSLNSRA